MRRNARLLATLLMGAGVTILGVRAGAKTATVTLKPNTATTMTVRQPLKRTGEWVVKVHLSSDGEKNVKVTARRGAGTSFPVLDTTSSADTEYCEGAAGSLYCDQITVPAVPAPGTWTFTARNNSSRPTRVELIITWHELANAG